MIGQRAGKNRNIRKRTSGLDEDDLNAALLQASTESSEGLHEKPTNTGKPTPNTSASQSTPQRTDSALKSQLEDGEAEDDEDEYTPMKIIRPTKTTSSASKAKPTAMANTTPARAKETQGQVSKPNGAQKPAQKSMLSFFDEEEEMMDATRTVPKKVPNKNPTEIKARGSGTKVTRNETPVSERTVHSVYSASSVGEYTPEKMAELQKMTFRKKLPIASPAKKEAAQSGEEIPLDLEEGEDAPTFVPPDATAIRAIKEIRDRRRKEGKSMSDGASNNKLEEEFISLIGKDENEVEEKSRLIREDDDDDDETLDDRKANHIPFGDPGKEKPSQKAVVIDDGDSDMDVSEDEEVKIVENSHIKSNTRGIATPNNPSQVHGYSADSFNPSTMTFHSYADYKPDLIWSKFSNLHQRIKEDCTNLSSEQNQLKNKFTSKQEELAALEKEESQIIEQYKFYQEMKIYLDDLLDCLNTKVPMIEEVEEEATKQRCKIASEYYEKKKETRREDIQWYLEEAGVIAEVKSGVDELGRDRSFAKLSVKRKRAEARKRFVQKLNEKKEANPNADEWSSDEDEEVFLNIKKIDDETAESASTIMSDTIDEYRSLKLIKERLEDWRNRYPTSYREAYVSDSAHRLFAPFIRLENLTWYPFINPDFTKTEWCSLLFDYGMSENPDLEDEDSKVLPTLIEKVLLVLVLDLFKTAWNPESINQSKAAIKFIQETVVFIEPSSQSILDIFDAILGRLRDVGDDCSIPVHPKALVDADEDLSTRCFWRCVKVLHIVKLWSGLLSISALQEIVTGILSNHIVPYLKACKVNSTLLHKCEKVCEQFPNSWMQSTHNRGVPSFARDFGDFVVRSLCSRKGGAMFLPVERLCKLLKSINDHENCAKIFEV